MSVTFRLTDLALPALSCEAIDSALQYYVVLSTTQKAVQHIVGYEHFPLGWVIFDVDVCMNGRS